MLRTYALDFIEELFIDTVAINKKNISNNLVYEFTYLITNVKLSKSFRNKLL